MISVGRCIFSHNKGFDWEVLRASKNHKFGYEYRIYSFTPFSPIINNLNLFGLKWNHIFGFSWSRDLWSFVTWLLFCGKDKKISLVPRVKDEVDAARESCMEEECERVEAEIAKERVHNENRMLKVLITRWIVHFWPCPKSLPV